MVAITYPTFLPGHEPTSAEYAVLLGKYAVKSADQSVTSSTTMVNDSHLLLTVESGASYVISAALGITGAGSATVGDILLQWTFPAGTLTWHGIGPVAGVAYGTSTSAQVNNARFRTSTSPSSPSMGFGTPSVNFGMVHLDMFYTCTTDGTLQLQWAQRVSSGTATTVGAGSYLLQRRVA